MYKSISAIPDISLAVQNPNVFFNSLELPDFSLIKLQLKVTMPMMLLKNLDPSLILITCIIKATILTGIVKKKNVFILKIATTSTD